MPFPFPVAPPSFHFPPSYRVEYVLSGGLPLLLSSLRKICVSFPLCVVLPRLSIWPEMTLSFGPHRLNGLLLFSSPGSPSPPFGSRVRASFLACDLSPSPSYHGHSVGCIGPPCAACLHLSVLSLLACAPVVPPLYGNVIISEGKTFEEQPIRFSIFPSPVCPSRYPPFAAPGSHLPESFFVEFPPTRAETFPPFR